jgi:hypothetical protein
MSGIVYRALASCGFSIFEITEVSPAVLDGILEDMTAETGPGSDDIESPAETSVPGVYAFDLIRYQTQHPERSSKQALRDFLENTPFLELHLTCGHVPPWLEADYKIDAVSTSGGGISAVVWKKQCSE